MTRVTIAYDYQPGWDLLRRAFTSLFPAVFFNLVWSSHSDAAVLTVTMERGTLLWIMPNINLTLPYIVRVRSQSHFMLSSSCLNLCQAVSSPGLFLMTLTTWFQISLQLSLSPCSHIHWFCGISVQTPAFCSIDNDSSCSICVKYLLVYFHVQLHKTDNEIISCCQKDKGVLMAC